jgi:hypothetical protein
MSDKGSDSSFEIDILPKPSGTRTIDIISFNHYKDLSKGVEQLCEIYQLLFDYGLWLSGFQFIGLAVESTDNLSTLQEITNFFLVLGLCVSIFSCLTAFITLRYLRGIEGETNQFIFLGLQKFKKVFKIADALLFCSTILFTISVNLLAHQKYFQFNLKIRLF